MLTRSGACVRACAGMIEYWNPETYEAPTNLKVWPALRDCPPLLTQHRCAAVQVQDGDESVRVYEAQDAACVARVQPRWLHVCHNGESGARPAIRAPG